MHLDANELGETIKEWNTTSTQKKVKAMILLRHHLNEDLKVEYLTVKDPSVLWKSLKDRYDHLKTLHKQIMTGYTCAYRTLSLFHSTI